MRTLGRGLLGLVGLLPVLGCHNGINGLVRQAPIQLRFPGAQQSLVAAPGEESEPVKTSRELVRNQDQPASDLPSQTAIRLEVLPKNRETPAASPEGTGRNSALEADPSLSIRQVGWQEPVRPALESATTTEPESGSPSGNSATQEPEKNADDQALSTARSEADAAVRLRRQAGYQLGTRPASDNPLTLEEVLASVRTAFPPLLAAAQEREIALGELVANWGALDTVLKGETLNAPLGFYENYRHSLSVTQPVFSTGGYLYGGYKAGRGDFQPWFKERQTNEGGEFAAGAGLPLLKDRAIDKRRADIALADLGVQLTDPFIRSQLNQFTRDALVAYWDWVAAALILQVQEELLKLAENRVSQIETRVREGDLPRIARIDNERFVLARKTKLVEAELKLRQAAIKLSLFVRDEAGNMVLPGLDRAPDFPAVGRPVQFQLGAAMQNAFAQRPELEDVYLQIRQLEVQRELACNGLMPKLDLIAQASQDVGGAASNPDDKGELELEAGLTAEVPAQRRNARGKIAATNAKLQQLEIKRQFIENKIANELQIAMNGLENSARQFELARDNLNLARQALEVGRVMFDAGDIDLILLNIYEQSVTDAELSVVAAEREFFADAADYRLALGLADPVAGLILEPLSLPVPDPEIGDGQPNDGRNGEAPPPAEMKEETAVSD